MSDIVVGADSKKSFDPIPAGVHLARCYSICDVGTVFDERYGKDKHEIIITWELPDERGDFKDKDGVVRNQPRAISKTYTASLGEKANLRKDLVSWRGRDFTADELKGFSLKNILGKSCQLNIIHAVKGDKVWANVNAVLPIGKGMKHDEPENPVRLWKIGDPTDGVPAFILKRASQAKEWIEEPHAPPAVAEPPAEEEENVPF
jgi:hypothetical protein